MKKLSIILIIIISVAMAVSGTVYFLCQSRFDSLNSLIGLCQTDKNRLAGEKEAAEKKINEKVIIFNKLFVGKVLSAEGPVSYEDRLDLENAALDTGDADIINRWHNFLASKTEQEAQQSVLAILTLSADRITVQY